MKMLAVLCLLMSGLVCAMDSESSETKEAENLEQAYAKIAILEDQVRELRKVIEANSCNINNLREQDEVAQKTTAGLVEKTYKISDIETRLRALEDTVSWHVN